MLEASLSEQDTSLGFLRARFKRKRLIITELERYNEIRGLLIENRTTGSQGHVSYRDGGQEASVTRAAVHTGVKDTVMQTRHRGTYNRSLSWDQEQVHVRALRGNHRSISMQ